MTKYDNLDFLGIVIIKNSGFLVPESCNLAENVVDLLF